MGKSSSSFLLCLICTLLIHAAMLFSFAIFKKNIFLAKKLPVALNIQLSPASKRQTLAEKIIPRIPQKKRLMAPVDQVQGIKPQSAPVADNFFSDLRKVIEMNKFYPVNAKALGQKGTVEVTFNMHADGRITDIKVLTSSSHPLLDLAAVSTIEKVGTYRPIPKKLQASTLNFVQKIKFEI